MEHTCALDAETNCFLQKQNLIPVPDGPVSGLQFPNTALTKTLITASECVEQKSCAKSAVDTLAMSLVTAQHLQVNVSALTRYPLNSKNKKILPTSRKSSGFANYHATKIWKLLIGKV